MSAPGLNEKFAALSQREKVLTLVSGLALIFLVGFTFFIEPAMNALTKSRTDLAAEVMKRQTLNAQLELYSEALATDPNAEIKAEQTALLEEKAAMELTFADELEDLVTPAEMVMLVEKVFKHAGNLKLMEMSSLAPVSVFEGNEEMEGVDLYQHGVQMTFSGRYFDVKDFVEALESQTRQLYWRGIDYQVAEYPLAEVSIEVYTLSTEKAFIGVR